MAITKVLHMSADFENVVSSHLDNAIDYILQEKKLGKLHLSGGINCMTSRTYEQMMATKKMFGKTGGRQGYHFILSLKPGEGTPQQMYEIAMKFAEKAFHNEYEAVVAVHTDTEKIHAHIVLNSVNMVTGYKFQYKKGDWKRLYQPITNELCAEYGLSIVPAEAVRRAAEQARRKAEKEAETRRRAALEEKRREEARRKEEQMKKEHIRGIYDKMVSEADRLADTVFGIPFDQPYKWEYINYIDERRFTPMAELTEEDMQKPFLTYEQFVAEKERFNAVSDPEVSGISVQKETVSRTQDFLQNAESSLERFVEKAVTKQDYQRMTDKEKAEWVGISLSDMPGSIRRFKSKMEQLGIWHESTLEMTDAFMKLWNQVEKERDIPQNRNGYHRIPRR